MAKPKIILFDLETLPNLKEALKVWPSLSSFPGKTLKATISTIICAGWKELDKKKVHCFNAWDYKPWETNVNDDSIITKKIYSVLSEANAIVTHNGKRFDWKFLQTRLIKNGLQPLDKIPHIDTKELAARNLLSFNNKLDYLGDQLVDARKLKHEGWALWVGVHNKEQKAMKLMTKYCKQDVLLLEKIFKPLKPFAHNIPNYNLFTENIDGDRPFLCPSCGHDQILSKGWRITKTNTYRRFQCTKCGSYCRADAHGRNPR